jgi:hypothetical protein
MISCPNSSSTGQQKPSECPIFSLEKITERARDHILLWSTEAASDN